MIQSTSGYIDVAQIVLYLFWLFFAGLIFYLVRENKREGYPLELDPPMGGRVVSRGTANKKVYWNHDGQHLSVPAYSNDRDEVPVVPSTEWPGSPYIPTGNPMLDGVGPASYAQREDVPELNVHGIPALAPLRVATDHAIAAESPNPIGMRVLGCDGLEAGVVKDAWIDHAETIVRYLEVDTGTRSVLLPMTLGRVSRSTRTVKVASILAAQFNAAPTLRNPNQVTKLEEDKIMGYFCGGHLYATPERMGPIL